MDLYFDDDTEDIVIRGGDLALSSDDGIREAAIQDIKSHLGLFEGEYYKDNTVAPRFGIPWFDYLGVKGMTRTSLNTMLVDAILECNVVSSVESLESSIDRATRKATVTVKIILKSGELLEDSITIKA